VALTEIAMRRAYGVSHTAMGKSDDIDVRGTNVYHQPLPDGERPLVISPRVINTGPLVGVKVTDNKEIFEYH
jgi:hypothetical protein